MKWKELSGEERYRVVEMARKGEVPLKEICETFGVSRQTLYRAMDKADQASMAALEPKRPGRKGPAPEQVKLAETEGRLAETRSELEHWKTKYEVARTFLELERRYDRGEREFPTDKEGDSPSTRAERRRRRRARKPRRKGSG